jgi:hypothetical protein
MRVILALVYVDDAIVGGTRICGWQRVLEIIKAALTCGCLVSRTPSLVCRSRDLAAGTLKICRGAATLALVDCFAEYLLPDTFDGSSCLSTVGYGSSMQADRSLYCTHQLVQVSDAHRHEHPPRHRTQ